MFLKNNVSYKFNFLRRNKKSKWKSKERKVRRKHFGLGRCWKQKPFYSAWTHSQVTYSGN